MRQLFLFIALAIPAAHAQGQESFSDMRATSPPRATRATQASAAAFQFTDEAPQRSTDSAAIVAAIERLAGVVGRLQIQVDDQARPARSVVSQAGGECDAPQMFDGRGRQLLYDALGRLVQQRDGGQLATVIDQFCPGCEANHTQAHNFTSRSSLSPTTFGNIPMIDSNNNMANAIARVIMVEGRPQLILDPEPIGWIGRLCPWTRR